MRIAVHVSGELGVRTSRVLLAEPGVHVGLFDEDSKAKRVHRVDGLADWDVLVVDEISIGSRVQIERALALDLPVVLTGEAPTFDVQTPTLISGVLEGARLAMALAHSGLGGTDELMEAQLAWTVQGHPLRAGVGVTFPDPVGPQWGEPATVPDASYPTRGLVAPVSGKWRALTTLLTIGTDDGVTQRVYGLADDQGFLNGAALASAALAAGEGAYPTGINGPGDPDGVFLRNAQRAGLHIAAFTPQA